jgi:hypothetical protein
MTQREKILAGAVAAAGALWLASGGIDKYRAALDRNRGLEADARQALEEAHLAVLRGQHARRRLHDWQGRSLPAKIDVAESLYHDWLREQLAGAGLEVTQVADKTGSSRSQQYEELAVDVAAKGTLAQFTDFLHRFYSAVHLHRINSATLTATDAGQKLSINLTIGALALPGSGREDKLAEGEPRELEFPLEEARTRLVSRNLFAPPAPKAAGSAPDAQAADAVATMMTYGDRGWRLGLRIKSTGAMRYFHEGDAIEIGQFKGKVLQIERRRVVFETDKGKMELRINQNLSEATVIASPAA